MTVWCCPPKPNKKVFNRAGVMIRCIGGQQQHHIHNATCGCGHLEYYPTDTHVWGDEVFLCRRGQGVDIFHLDDGHRTRAFNVIQHMHITCQGTMIVSERSDGTVFVYK
jgi:hypothetical protein